MSRPAAGGGAGAGRTARAGPPVPKTAVLVFALAVGALLTAGGCGVTAAAPKAAAAAAVVTADTWRFTGRTLDGASFDASTLAGTPTLLWFWAPWCATCASEAQSVNDLRTEYAGRLSILGIAGMGPNKDMHQFVADLEVRNVNLDDQAGVLWRKFGITEQSTYVLIDRAGTVVTTGYLDDLQLTDRVRSLVA